MDLEEEPTKKKRAVVHFVPSPVTPPDARPNTPSVSFKGMNDDPTPKAYPQPVVLVNDGPEWKCWITPFSFKLISLVSCRGSRSNALPPAFYAMPH